jgi:peroxiredoxin Q/BCP
METNKLLEAGAKAPQFTLPDAEGDLVSLADFAGKKVVLYFYPRDNTPGCTRQACAFAGAFEEFKQIGAVVIGISKDSAASHKKFAEKHGLPFLLLSDPELAAIQAYGVWQEKKNYGKVSMGVVRSTFIIDENGVVEKVMPKVKPDTNAAEVLAYLKGDN